MEAFEIDYSDHWEGSTWWVVSTKDDKGFCSWDFYFENATKEQAIVLGQQLAIDHGVTFDVVRKHTPRLGCVLGDNSKNGCDCVIIPESGVKQMLSYRE